MAIDLPEIANSGSPEVHRKVSNPDLWFAVQGDTKRDNGGERNSSRDSIKCSLEMAVQDKDNRLRC
jgi:hypothetical protein